MTMEQLQAKVAQLEEQVAALSVQAQATTEPNSYATSKYSVEEMDTLLDYVASIKPATQSIEVV